MPKPLPDGSKPLTNPRHEAFVQALMRGASYVDAYRGAGYTPKPDAEYAAASQLFRNIKISQRLAYLETAAAEDSVLTRAWLIAQARSTYFAARAAGQLGAAVRMLEVLGRERATFIPKQEVTHTHDFAEMTDDELRAFIKDEVRELGLGDGATAAQGSSREPGKLVH